MSSDGQSHLERIGGALKNVQSFLRGNRFPGTVKRKEQSAEAGGACGQAGASFSGPGGRPGPHQGAAVDPVPSDQSLQEYVEVPPCSPSESAAVQTGHHSNVFEGLPPGNRDESRQQETSTSQALQPTVRSHSVLREEKLQKLLRAKMVNMDRLRELAWNGIPPGRRAVCWRLLLGYLPPNSDRQLAVLQRKRREYQSYVPEYYDISNTMRSEEEVGALRQVGVDVPRTAPGVPFFQQPAVQKSLERILYIWGIRHPASGYVQGINDLVTPFLVAFVYEHLEGPMDSWQLADLPEDVILNVEADTYWCLCKLLDGIQDHYTSAQPGIQRAVFKVRELVRRIDERVAQHLDDQGIDFLQFAFRWVNCLLVREVPFHLVGRLWDTYLAEGQRFSDFLVYACVAFLLHWSDELQGKEFQEMVIFLQHPPTADWTEQEIGVVLSHAHMYQTSFEKARSHLC
ncbi:unnamed protein product [Ostreobium quekettii]|uniref:Rab-GAP TBC domain-containing protein n=1 Tax=Ostreobium quekettii TaxID=121088 RepID=A0A8S1J5I1_9CHLO|nr:unnamed protein product [Ostreobium quekettii]|eukprot:evm.model.scf_1475.3 EVM.evm.TU.scf_1475.3   scf_1475:8044-12121(+)